MDSAESSLVTLTVNGEPRAVRVDNRMSVLDLLRERLGLTGSKKGCDHGGCGACTVLLEGRRVNACLLLAVACDGATVTTVEGLARHDGARSDDTRPDVAVSDSAVKDSAVKDSAVNDSADHDRVGLHPLQEQFARHDAFQCGYCTPGQLCSAAGMLAETGPSAVTDDLTDDPPLTPGEICERMSGNLCRCGAYVNIVKAISAVMAP